MTAQCNVKTSPPWSLKNCWNCLHSRAQTFSGGCCTEGAWRQQFYFVVLGEGWEKHPVLIRQYAGLSWCHCGIPSCILKAFNNDCNSEMFLNPFPIASCRVHHPFILRCSLINQASAQELCECYIFPSSFEWISSSSASLKVFHGFVFQHLCAEYKGLLLLLPCEVVCTYLRLTF